jgi:thiol:disulfide interchange protein DsbA
MTGMFKNGVIYMKIVTRWMFALMLPMLVSMTACADAYTQGQDYIELSNPQPTSSGDKIEVVELFWYGCPHCYHLDPFLEEWVASKPDDVEFVRMPAVLGKRWVLLAKAYYTAELLGNLDKIHLALFKALHEDKNKINDEAALQDFFVDQGVSAEDFKNTFNSFAVSVKVNNAKQMTRRYSLTGVPTIIVNGKYSTSPGLARSNEGVIKVMNYLVEKERR